MSALIRSRQVSFCCALRKNSNQLSNQSKKVAEEFFTVSRIGIASSDTRTTSHIEVHHDIIVDCHHSKDRHTVCAHCMDWSDSLPASPSIIWHVYTETQCRWRDGMGLS